MYVKTLAWPSGAEKGRGQEASAPPFLQKKKKFSENVPLFFEEPFKCVFFENNKSETVNIQQY